MGVSPHSWIQATVTAMAPYAFPKNQKIQNFNFSEKKSWRPFSGTEKAFFWSTSSLLAQQLMPLHIVTPWHGFDEPFKTKGGECCHAACACSTTTCGPIPRTSPLRFWKNSSGIIGPSALQSGPRAQRFPLVSSPKETSRWEKVRRRLWGARRSRDVVQRAGGRLLWLGDTEAGSKTNKCLENAGDHVEK